MPAIDIGKCMERYVLHINKDVTLELLSLNHRDELFALIDANREYLRAWLPWLDGNTSPADTEEFIKAATLQYEAGMGPQYAIFHRSDLCGVCGFHEMDHNNRVGSIGYWIGQEYSGKGIMTQSVKTLIEVGFTQYKLNRIEIRCAVENHKSRAIPERLGFQLEGVLRQKENLYGEFVDLALYSLLAAPMSA